MYSLNNDVSNCNIAKKRKKYTDTNFRIHYFEKKSVLESVRTLAYRKYDIF